ncbi:MAG: hypothetical protein RR865_13780, partial [Clostridia bacterium]
MPSVTAELTPTANAFVLRRFFCWIRFVVFLPPLNSTSIAAKTPRPSAPFRFKVYPAILAYWVWMFLAAPLFLLLLSAIHDAATVTAKPPPAPSFPGLLNMFAAFRAGVHKPAEISLGIVVFHAAFTAAIFLSADVAGWLKCFSTKQTVQFCSHGCHLIKIGIERIGSIPILVGCS